MRIAVPAARLKEIWDYLLDDITKADSIGLLLKDDVDAKISLNKADLVTLLKGLKGHYFIDEFNKTIEDTDVWVSGGDDGSLAPTSSSQTPTYYWMQTGAVIDNDRYIHGDGVKKNYAFTPYEEGITTITFTARLRITAITDINVFLGLARGGLIDYAEYPGHCAHFFVDPAVSATFRARSYSVGEEETDTLVSLDTSYHTFKIEWTVSDVKFYIDDVLKATHTSQVPDCSLISSILVRTKAAAAKGLCIDKVEVEAS